MEEIFGIDKKGRLIYDEEKNQVLAIESVENMRQHYGDYKSFLKWVGNKSKKELQDAAEAIVKLTGNMSILVNQLVPSNFNEYWNILKKMSSHSFFREYDIDDVDLDMLRSIKRQETWHNVLNVP